MKKRKDTRRRFIKKLGAGALGLGLARCIPHVEGEWGSCDEEPPEPPPQKPDALVVEVRSADAVVYDPSQNRSIVDPEVVSAMVDEGLRRLASSDSAQQAWSALLAGRQGGEQVGIKVNALNERVPTRPELVAALVSSLVRHAAVPAGEIFVWDRTELELRQAGLTRDVLGVECVGTEMGGGDDSGPGYETEETVCLSGRQIRLSTLLTRRCGHLINVAVLKNHFIAGFTGCLKNHYGSFPNPYEFHDECERYIALLNAIPQVSGKCRLYVLDALRIVTMGDTDKPADAEPGRILFSLDPVAIDTRGVDVRDEFRREAGAQPGGVPGYLELAESLGLGSRDYRLEPVEL